MATGVELATAYVSLSVSGSNIGPEVRRMFAGVDSQADRAGRSAGRKMGSGMGSSVLGAVKGFAGPIAAALGVGFLADFTRDAVNLGSDLEQSLGGAQAVFKENFEQIDASAKSAADNLGISRTSYNELATVLGAGLKNKGIEDFAGTTQDLIDLGADLAAQYGGSTKDAVGAIASAMRGESDPIERYGISLSETAVSAELARRGLEDLEGPALDQAKAAARVAILTQQSADAQGAFARESDTLAGKQQRLAATWEDMKTQVGTALLPVLTDLAGWFLDDGLPAVQEFGGWIRDVLWPALQEGYETIMPGLEQALDIITGGLGDGNVSWREFGTILTEQVIPFIADLMNVYLPYAATQIRAVIEVVSAAWAAFQTWRDITGEVTAVIVEGFARVMETGADMLSALSNVPGFGWAKDAARDMYEASAAASSLASELRGIGDKSVTVDVNFTSSGRVALANGVAVDMGVYRARAAGGPVRAGGAYVVGEHQPEFFFPHTDGQILTGAQLASATGGGGMDYGRVGREVASALHQSGTFEVEARQVGRAVRRSENMRSFQ